MGSQHAAAAALPRLDLWVAATMGMDSPIRRLLARSGVGQDALAAVRSAAAAAGISERSFTALAQVVEFFGVSARVRPDRLVYDSVLWPAHQFVWAVSRWGDAGPLGFRLREPLPVGPLRLHADLGQLHAHFRAWYHTEHEVRCALGAADQVLGGAYSSRWLYVISPGRLYVAFAFTWGLLRDISMRPDPADVVVRGARRSSPRGPLAPPPPGKTSRGV